MERPSDQALLTASPCTRPPEAHKAALNQLRCQQICSDACAHGHRQTQAQPWLGRRLSGRQAGLLGPHEAANPTDHPSKCNIPQFTAMTHEGAGDSGKVPVTTCSGLG